MNLQKLQAQRSEYQASIRMLTEERASLAPAAINGSKHGPAARARIKEIDLERAAFAAEVETIEQALASPEYQKATRQAMLTQRLDATFKKNKASHQAKLIGGLCNRYHTLSLNDNLKRAGTTANPFDLDALPRIIAAEITGEAHAEQERAGMANLGELHHSGDPRIDNTLRFEELGWKVEIFKRHTRELLASTKLPAFPPALQAKLDGRPLPTPLLPETAWDRMTPTEQRKFIEQTNREASPDIVERDRKYRERKGR